MAKRQFTEEELAFLRRNPYTAYVDANTLSFTVAFKAEFMRLYSEGIPPKRNTAKAWIPHRDYRQASFEWNFSENTDGGSFRNRLQRGQA